MSWWKSGLLSLAIGGVALGFKNLEPFQKHLAIQAVTTIGGIMLCVAALVYISKSFFIDRSGSGFQGKNFELFLILVAGPITGLFIASDPGNRTDLAKAAMFGWGFAPTALAIWCLDGPQRRPAARYAFIGYAIFTSVVLTFGFLSLITRRGEPAFMWLAIAAAVVVLGLWTLKRDEQHEHAAARIDLPPQFGGAMPNPHDHQKPEPVHSSGSIGSAPFPERRAAPAFKPAPASLADDFDVPPQR